MTCPKAQSSQGRSRVSRREGGAGGQATCASTGRRPGPHLGLPSPPAQPVRLRLAGTSLPRSSLVSFTASLSQLFLSLSVTYSLTQIRTLNKTTRKWVLERDERISNSPWNPVPGPSAMSPFYAEMGEGSSAPGRCQLLNPMLTYGNIQSCKEFL